MTSFVQLAPLAFLAWLLWKLFRNYVVRSPLDNVRGPAPSSFWIGSVKDLFNLHAWDFHDRLIRQYGPVSMVYTALRARALYVFDPKALHSIFVKDQYTYEEPAWFVRWNGEVYGPSLIATLGEHHRKQRKLLNPVFSIAHMRYMTPIFYGVAHRLRDAIRAQVNVEPKNAEIDVLEWMSRAALELVGQAALGYSFDPLVGGTVNEFGRALKVLAPTTFALHFWRLLVPYFVPSVPLFIRRVFMQWVPHKNAQKMRAISETLASHSRKVYDEKMAALAKGDDAVVHQIGEGRDLLSILIRSNMSASKEDKLPEEEVIAQMSTIVFAATDTSSNALARILQLLAENADTQDKLRAELMEAAGGGEDIPYDQLIELPYLDAVCRETLRLHPPAPGVSRIVREDIVMPLSEPIQGVDGSTMTDILVPKGTQIIVSIWGCNRNEALWGGDAHEWRPERWLVPLPKAVGEARVPGVYANLMTFLGGGRACIGFKFAQLEIKVVLAVMLRSFRFLPSDKEVYWNMAGVNYPTMGKNGPKPELMLKIEALSA